MKKALFWDFDGTLVFSYRIWRNSLYDILTKLGYNIDSEKLRFHLSSKNKGFSWDTPEIAYTDTAGQKWWDKLFKHLDIFYEGYMLPKEDIEKANLYLKNQVLDYRNYTLYDDSEIVLQKCSEMGYKNYIISNNYPELPLVIKDLRLDKYFTDYIVSAVIGYEKPRTEIFQYALKAADFPNDCYMIGDNPIADIKGGKSAGMKTILVHNDGNYDADYKYKNLSDILLILT